VTRAVDVGIPSRRRLVLDVREVDGDALAALLGCAVDLIASPPLRAAITWVSAAVSVVLP